jgi:hypothetical protein
MPRYVLAAAAIYQYGTAGVPEAQARLGTGRLSQLAANRFPDGYLFRPDEVEPFFEAAGFATLELRSVNAFVTDQPRAAELMERDAAAFSALAELVWQYSTDHSLFGIANQLLYLGRRT